MGFKMKDAEYIKKVKSDIANKKSMVSGLRSQLKSATELRDKKSFEEEIRRQEQEIHNLEIQLR